MILSRRVAETLVIGDNIRVTVLGVKGNQCRIGVDCDRNMPVHREEVYNRLMQEEGGVHSFADNNKSSKTRFCDCFGDLAPGAVCKWIVTGDGSICGYKGDEHCEHME